MFRSRVWVSCSSLEVGSQVQVSGLGLGFCLMFRSHVWVSCSGFGSGISGLGFRSWVGVLDSGLRGSGFMSGS